MRSTTGQLSTSGPSSAPRVAQSVPVGTDPPGCCSRTSQLDMAAADRPLGSAAAFRCSPFALFGGSVELLRLLTDALPEDDALAAALACRALYRALCGRFRIQPAACTACRFCTATPCRACPRAGKRFVTRNSAVVASASRLVWVRNMPQTSPKWPPGFAGHYSFRLDAAICRAIARAGSLEVLQFARGKGIGWDATTCQEAALAGHLDCLRWARENNCP